MIGYSLQVPKIKKLDGLMNEHMHTPDHVGSMNAGFGADDFLTINLLAEDRIGVKKEKL
jgi:hypothetical protein